MNNSNILHSIQLRGQTIVLEHVEGNLLLRSASTDQIVNVSSSEGSQILNVSGDMFERKLQYRGFYLDEQAEQSELAQQIAFINSRFSKDNLLVMLDTTTVHNALSIIESGRVTPLSLLDLATLTFAAVSFDQIVIQPYQSLRYVKRKLPNLFLELKYPEEFIPKTLWSTCAGLFNEFNGISKEYGKKLTDSWCRFLNLDLDSFKLDIYMGNQHQDSPYYWNGVAASYFISYLTDLMGTNKYKRSEFLSIQTLRTLFNDRLAGLIGLPYLASAFRTPVYSEILKMKMQNRLLIDQLLASIGPQVSTSPNEDSPYVSELSAPFLLGLILEQMSKPSDYWDLLIGYRNRFAPLRDKIRQERNNWQGKSGHYLKSYLKHLNGHFKDEFKRGGEVVNASVTVGTALTAATPVDGALINLGVKVLQLLKPSERLHHWYLKQFRPEIHLLFDLAKEAEQLSMAEQKIHSIWGTRWGRAEHRQLKWLAGSQPNDFLKLRQLDDPSGV